MKIAKIAAAGLLFVVAGAALAAEPTTPEAIARAQVMSDIGKNMKILGEMAAGKTAFAGDTAAAAKAAMLADVAQIHVAFATEGQPDPVSEAKPEIWTNWDDFLVKAEALNTALAAVDVASVETIQASMAPLGASCKGCHTLYRR